MVTVFKVGEQLNDAALPEWMMSEEMNLDMNTLTAFSEKDREYFQYQARQELAQTTQVLNQTSQALAKAKLEKDAALAELERLRALLADKQP